MNPRSWLQHADLCGNIFKNTFFKLWPLKILKPSDNGANAWKFHDFRCSGPANLIGAGGCKACDLSVLKEDGSAVDHCLNATAFGNKCDSGFLSFNQMKSVDRLPKIRHLITPDTLGTVRCSLYRWWEKNIVHWCLSLLKQLNLCITKECLMKKTPCYGRISKNLCIN